VVMCTHKRGGRTAAVTAALNGFTGGLGVIRAVVLVVLGMFVVVLAGLFVVVLLGVSVVDPAGVFVVVLAGMSAVDPTGVSTIDPTGVSVIDPAVLFVVDPAVLFVIDPAVLFVVGPAGLFIVDPAVEGISGLVGSDGSGGLRTGIRGPRRTRCRVVDFEGGWWVFGLFRGPVCFKWRAGV